MSISELTVTNAITAIGTLGTAAFGLVDATKAIAGGGISRVGLNDIKRALQPLFGLQTSTTDRSTPLTFASVLDTLAANWMDGTNLADQKAMAKSLIKLRLSPDTAPNMAAATGVDPIELSEIAKVIQTAGALTPQQENTFNRFDQTLASLFDQAYQRADQRYRNAAKLLAGAFSLVIAIFSGLLYFLRNDGEPSKYLTDPTLGFAIISGLLATPIAPVAKDLASTIAAGTDVIQSLRKKP